MARGRRGGSLVPLERDPNGEPVRDCRRWLLRVSTGKDPVTGKYGRANRVVHGTRREADTELRKLLGLQDQGVEIPRSRLSLWDWLEQALERAVHLGPQTRHRARGAFASSLPEWIRAIKLRDLRRRHFEELYAELTAAGQSPATVAYLHRELRARLTDAVKDGHLVLNPAKGAKLPRAQHIERATLSPAQVRELLEAVAFDRLGAVWAVLVLGGLRPEEALALRWADFDGAAVQVRRALVWVPKHPPSFEPTKGKRARVVPLPARACRFLERQRSRQADERKEAKDAYQDQDLIFATELGRPVRWQTLGRRFRALAQALKLPPMRPYDLRHTCATLLLEAGVNAKVVQERLGHASIKVTLDVYSHVTATMQEQATAALDAIAGGAAG